jgi:tellurite resistance protein TerC
VKDTLWPWILFNLFVVLMLALDLGVFHRKTHEIKMKEALAWSVFWITLSLIFNVVIYYAMGPQPALEFLTGYIIEKSLSVDNIFVFIMIFAFFKVPPIYQHKVLFWGIFGALVMRAVFIAAGVSLIHQFHWIIYIFGGFLIITGIRMTFQKDKEIHPERNPVVKAVQRLFPVAPGDTGGKFFSRWNGRLHATPLFMVLLVVESSDLIFAVDSIPAVIAVTDDPFIIYTSNVFAILGLRALYFAMSSIVPMFRYLSYGLSAVLTFVGVKMILTDIYKIPVQISLMVIALILLVSVGASVLVNRKEKSDGASLP